MGVCVPQDLGGAGADYLTYVLVIEELSRGDAGLGVTLAVHTGAGTLPIIARGTRQQIERLVPPLAQGHELAAFALTESNAGSDPSALATRSDNGNLTGTKQWVTNGSVAHVFIVFAKDPDRPSAFIVRRGAHGFKPVRETDKLGLNSSSTADLQFDETPGRAARPARRRPADRARDARRRADRHRRAGDRHRAGGARPRGQARQGAAHVRQADRRPPGDPAEARRHADRDRGRPRADLARRAAEGRRPPAHRRGRAGQALRLGASRGA